MTTLTLKFPAESLTTGAVSSVTPASAPGQIYYAEFNAARPEPLPNAISLDSLLSEFESDGQMAGHLENARKELSRSLYKDEPSSFSALRLSHGLSQAQLAEKAGTSQSHIAKIEAGKNDPGATVIARIAQAMQVDATDVFNAVLHQINTRRDTR